MKIIFTISFFFLLGISFSQSEIALKTKVKENEILLRWTPIEPEYLREAIQNGFTLSRKEWNGTGNPTESFWKSELDFRIEIKAPVKNDSIWTRFFRSDSDVGILYSFAFPEKKLSEMEEQNLFGLTLLSCDLNPSLAKLAGLYFKDSSIMKGKNYAYKIEVNAVNKATVVNVQSETNTVLPIMESFKLNVSGKSVEVSWNFQQFRSHYSGYFIERSEDGKNFGKLNEKPIIPMASQYEKDKEIMFFTDTTVQENKTYWYRLAGKDHFGETGDFSHSEKIFVSSVFKGELIIDTLYSFINDSVKLIWSFTDEKDQGKSTGIEILRSRKMNGEYELLKEMDAKVSQADFILTERENYIKVRAKNTGMQMESWPQLLLMPDRVPPLVPDSLTGIIDKKGKVTLKWKKSSENDLRGYRIFRANALHESMVEVSKNFITENIFEDSVDINSLTEEIYFSVNAVDSSYNNSKQSFPVRLQKPDFIAPVVAPIVRVSAMEKGNFIQWNFSTSRDVVKTEIRRSEDNKTFKAVFISMDTSSQFMDTSVLSEMGYHYKTVVFDDADNSAESESFYIFNPIKKMKVDDSVFVTVNRTDKYIHLKWSPINTEVYSYTIYKAKKGEQMRSYKTVNGNILELKDTELHISNEYVYSIKAVLKSGREVMVKEVLEVEY